MCGSLVSGDNVLGPVKLGRCAKQIERIGGIEEVLSTAPIGGLIPTWPVQVQPAVGQTCSLSHAERNCVSVSFH